MKTESIAVRVSDKTASQLKEIAARRGVPVSDVLRRWVDAGLRYENTRDIRSAA
jgi:antitoxin component of RelBE/YafQ-DinJ toxin-antitoxin module